MLYFTKTFRWTPIFLPPLQNNSQYLFLSDHGSKKHQFLSQNCAFTVPATGCLRVTCALTQLHEALMMEPHDTELLVLIEHSSWRVGNWVEMATLSL